MSLDKEFKLEKDFSPPTYEEWLAAAEESLKGAPFEKLMTRTYEGIDLQPIYTKKDRDGLPGLNQKPGFAGYMRGTSAGGYAAKPWDICQETRAGLAPQFNEALKTDLKRGQTAINLSFDAAARQGLDSDQAEASLIGQGGIAVSTPGDFADALAGIDIETTPLHIDAGFSGLEAAMMLKAFLGQQKKDGSQIRGSIAVDPLGYLAAHGSLPVSLPVLYDGMAGLTSWARKEAPGLKTIAVSGVPYHNAGADAVRELAYTLATAVEYIDRLLERRLTIDEIAGSMRFTLAVGPFYFMEIAKIRAARVLWAKIVESYGGVGEAQKIAIHARTSTYYQTKYDPYVNMLRVTTEAFSAVTAGADSLHTDPFDAVSGTGDEFSRRVARNTQILLREECRVDKLIDPAGGSYYVESLTHQVCRKAWKLFQEIEGKGGMFKALESGFPQDESAALHDKRKLDIAKRKSLIVGTNFSANVKEKKPGTAALNHDELARTRRQYLEQYRNSRTPGQVAEIETKLSALASSRDSNGAKIIAAGTEAFQAGATLNQLASAMVNKGQEIQIKPLAFHRAAEIFEELRDAVELFKEKTGAAPKLFLATMGPLSQYKARADFSQAFFEVGGFEVIYPQFPQGKGYDTPEAAVEAALQSGAPVVVICSTDDTYPQLVPPITRALKEKNPAIKVILAGFPKDQVDMHKQAGVDDFIYLGADVYQVLSRLLKGLGV